MCIEMFAYILQVFFKVVNLPGGEKQVTIYGFDDDVMAAVGNVHKFLGQSQVSEDTINISAGCAAYIKEHKGRYNQHYARISTC